MSDVVRFTANEISLDPRVGFIGFTDQERYFWMQPGEMTTSKDEIWLERDDQAWGGCGGSWNIVLTRDRFFINTRKLSWMACDAVEIEFIANDATYVQLMELLQKAMVECPADLEIRE
jgi:hypothetical protein